MTLKIRELDKVLVQIKFLRTSAKSRLSL